MKKASIKIFIVCFLLINYNFSFGQAQILYNQTQNTDAPDLSSQDFETASNSYDCQAADDFIIPNDTFWVIDSVFIQGGYSLFGGPCDSVKFYFYQNSGGLPGTALYSVTKGSVDQTGSGDFVVRFSPALVLPDGHYWLSVQAIMNYSTVGGWYWSTQTVQKNNKAAWKNPGGGFNTTCASWSSASTCSNISPDLSFKIFGRDFFKLYCIPVMNPGTSGGDFIDGVTLGSINNMGTGAFNGSFYNDYTNLSTTINNSSTYQLVIKGGSYAPDYYAAWIDYNGNFNLNDPGEKIGMFQTSGPFQTQIITFTVPSNAVIGPTRLRVRCIYSSSDNNDPCVNSTYGETEDYEVVIAPALGLPPVADFVANNTNIVTGSTVNFTDLSFNAPISWSWQFPGASPAFSTVQNPQNILYSSSGFYNVVLIATNAFGSDTMTKVSYITVTGGSAPVTDFIASSTNIFVGDTIGFYDLSTNSPTSWQWVFTNAVTTSSLMQNPTGIIYNTPGCHPVTLIAANSFGSDSEIKNCYINVVLSSVKEEDVSKNFMIGPNPTTGIINIETLNAIENIMDFKMHVFDMVGQQVLSYDAGYNSIDLSSLNDGVYFIKAVRSGNGTSTESKGMYSFCKKIVKASSVQ